MVSLRNGLELLRGLLRFDTGCRRVGGGIRLVLESLCNCNRLGLRHTSSTVVPDADSDDNRMSELPRKTEGVGLRQLTAPGLRR